MNTKKSELSEFFIYFNQQPTQRAYYDFQLFDVAN